MTKTGAAITATPVFGIKHRGYAAFFDIVLRTSFDRKPLPKSSNASR
ncbi:MAG: hypothetical protein JKY52_20065 [Flavobacteriales bacterium]|nr:hypothetical protein [Flavobacteriales bacterium]